jgi:hypothetical protein
MAENSTVLFFRGSHVSGQPRSIDTDGGGGNGGGMEDLARRVTNLEATVSEIRGTVGTISERTVHLATTNALSQLELRLIKWIVGTTIAAVAAISAAVAALLALFR